LHTRKATRILTLCGTQAINTLIRSRAKLGWGWFSDVELDAIHRLPHRVGPQFCLACQSSTLYIIKLKHTSGVASSIQICNLKKHMNLSKLTFLILYIHFWRFLYNTTFWPTFYIMWLSFYFSSLVYWGWTYLVVSSAIKPTTDLSVVTGKILTPCCGPLWLYSRY
jgi:hypothetical protein